MTINKMIACFCIATATLLPNAVHAQSQREMNEDALKEYQKADVELNKAYRVLFSKLDAEAVKKLKASQKAWIVFRDAEAELAADLGARGGSLAPLIYHVTRHTLTEERTKELLKMLKDRED